MAPRISLSLALHNHQPVGNFGWVIQENFEAAYGPMLEALERHPTIRVSLHYSGPLLSWLRAEQPSFVARLAALVARGQVEILGGGWYEPVLASLPERDRVGQLVRMADELEATFGSRPRGAWLAERVWEPDVPTSLVAAGYAWTILDDAHFRAAAIPDAEMWGPYTTEDQGRVVSVFGTEQGLRYRIPFRDVDEVVRYLGDHATEAGDRLGVMGDDGEKFGGWPTTRQHCWGDRGWVERFFEALEANAEWLTTTTPSAWLEREPPVGRVYIPTSSYAEMGEWALPPDEAVAYGEALHRAEMAHDPAARWLRGAFWRNFQVRYREVNDLHKQMLRASDKVDAMAPGPIRDAALDHLYQGQSNDCYWHGLFGGIYLSHMRLATHAHLIAAEDAADAVATAGGCGSGLVADLDLDGRPEILLATAGQVVTIKPDEGAGIGSWDIRAARHALASVMRRRPEAYHERLRRREAEALAQAAAATEAEAGSGSTGAPDVATYGEPASIHERVAAKEGDLTSRLHYDWHERRSGLVHLFAPDATIEDWATAEAADLAGAANGTFRVVEVTPVSATLARDADLGVVSRISVGGGRLDPMLRQEVTIDNRTAEVIEGRLGLEWSTTMLGGGGNPAAWWDLAGERSAHDVARAASGVDSLAAGNDWVGIVVDTQVSPAADVWIAPIETISNSEAGFERVYQGSGLLLSWLVRIAPGTSATVSVVHRAAVARDLAAEEGLPVPG